MQITCHKFFVKVIEFFIKSNFKVVMCKVLEHFFKYNQWFFYIWHNGIEFAILCFAMRRILVNHFL